jgi:ubiquitin-conjugating enzyme E2 variant
MRAAMRGTTLRASAGGARGRAASAAAPSPPRASPAALLSRAAPTQCALAPPAAARIAAMLSAAAARARAAQLGASSALNSAAAAQPPTSRDAFAPPADAASRPLGPAVLPPDEARHLVSTPAQRAVFAAWAALEAALLASALASPGVAASVAAAPAAALGAFLALVTAAWLAADLIVGLFHFFVDNYGSADTPVMGSTVDAFQGHHTQPWLITRGQFCTVVEGPCMTQLPLQLAALACAGPAGRVFMAAYAFWSVTAQLAHAWSHERRSQLPAAVRALQDAGVLISCKARGQLCACALLFCFAEE